MSQSTRETGCNCKDKYKDTTDSFETEDGRFVSVNDTEPEPKVELKPKITEQKPLKAKIQKLKEEIITWK